MPDPEAQHLPLPRHHRWQNHPLQDPSPWRRSDPEHCLCFCLCQRLFLVLGLLSSPSWQEGPTWVGSHLPSAKVAGASFGYRAKTPKRLWRHFEQANTYKPDTQACVCAHPLSSLRGCTCKATCCLHTQGHTHGKPHVESHTQKPKPKYNLPVAMKPWSPRVKAHERSLAMTTARQDADCPPNQAHCDPSHRDLQACCVSQLC